MNNWTIAGKIGKDAVTRTTQGGDSVTGWSVAINNGKDKPPTWVDCSMWGDRGSKVCQYLTKGSNVTVSGQANCREHEGKAYLMLNVSQVTLMGGGEQKDDRPAAKPKQDHSQQLADDEIPF